MSSQFITQGFDEIPASCSSHVSDHNRGEKSIKEEKKRMERDK